MVRRYDLAQAIAQYDQVIDVIELYQDDHGSYPRELQALVPDYLSEVPGVYIRAGEVLEYAVESEGLYSFSYDVPFVFYVYGHHTGLQNMHGWELRYCPIEYDSCNQADGRDYHPHRIDDRWIWINRSAL